MEWLEALRDGARGGERGLEVEEGLVILGFKRKRIEERKQRIQQRNDGKCYFVLLSVPFPELPMVVTICWFDYTGPNPYYIFLSGKNKTSYESVTRSLNDIKTHTHAYSPFLRNLMLKSVQQSISLHIKNVSACRGYTDDGNQ